MKRWYNNVFAVASSLFNLLILLMFFSLSACVWDASLADELVDRDGRVIPCKGMQQIVFESGVCVEGDCLECSKDGSKLCEDYQFIFKLKTRFCPIEYANCDGSECRICPKNEVFCHGKCIDPMFNLEYCGASGQCQDENAGVRCSGSDTCSHGVCGTYCPSGQLLCDDLCIDPSESMNNCGASRPCSENPGVNCLASVQNAYDVLCVEGACKYGLCKPGYGNCDNDLSNGCETDINTSNDHCGSCGDPCSALLSLANVQAAECVSGKCSLTCEGTYGNCDKNERSGCETDLSQSYNHCGNCDKKCSWPLSCKKSACSLF